MFKNYSEIVAALPQCDETYNLEQLRWHFKTNLYYLVAILDQNNLT